MSKKESKTMKEEKRASFQQRYDLIIDASMVYDKHNTESSLFLVALVTGIVLALRHDSSEKGDMSATMSLGLLMFFMADSLMSTILNKSQSFDTIQQFQQDTEFRKQIFAPNLAMKSAQRIKESLSERLRSPVPGWAILGMGLMNTLTRHILDFSREELFIFMVGQVAGLFKGRFYALKSRETTLLHRSRHNGDRIDLFLRKSPLATSSHIRISRSDFGTDILFNADRVKLIVEGYTVVIPRDLLITLVNDLMRHAFPWAFIESTDSAIAIASIPYVMEVDEKSWQTKFTQIFSQYRALQKVVKTHYQELAAAISSFTHQRWHCQYSSQWLDEDKPTLAAVFILKTLALEADEIESLMRVLKSSGYTSALYSASTATISFSVMIDTPKQYADNLKEAVRALHQQVEVKSSAISGPPQEPAPLEISRPTHCLLPPLALGSIREELKNRNARYSSSLFTADTKHVETAIIYKFGEEHGECVLNDSCSKPLGAIRQLSQDDKPQNLFIKVTEKGEKALGKSGLDEKLVLAELDKACIVPHEYGQAHQKSGFVFSKEVSKGAGEPILIKLHFGFSPYSLYAVTWEAFEQENGTIAYLFLLDKCEDLHGRTNHLAKFPPKPMPVRAALT